MYDLQVDDGKLADPLSLTILQDSSGIDSLKIVRQNGYA